ncbi:MAG TPA: hypothetical protein VHA82_10650 [Ramlibacter sp.]|uniref:hypothetical protein n=1 Tax=Ramlibacter sp. TaxID=1917967 RepID=UPI002C7F6D13|nr:hypothetical protein [Ramlibacter sp.]HVZ44257.1 hypothetical protein [Ramlibacter sp.]
MSFHLYDITELFSNASGAVQFIELHVDNFDGESFWAGQSITVRDGATTHTFTFPSNLPNQNTANTSVLLATQGFADLGLVTPDFIVPAGFLLLEPGTTVKVNYAGVSVASYTNLPTDGFHSLTGDAVSASTANPTPFTTVSIGHPKDFAGNQTDMPQNQSIVNGAAGNDALTGTAASDEMNGFAGNDTLYGGVSGGDTLNGGDGLDWAIVGSGLATVESFTPGPTAVLGTTHGTLTMTGVERIALTDALFAFDTGVNQPVWQAEALLWAVTGAAPSRALLSQWTAVADHSANMAALAQTMLDTYVPGIPSAPFVQFLYQALVHQTPTPDQVQQLTDLIGPGRVFADNGAFFAAVASTGLNTQHFADFVGTVQQLDTAFF